MKFMRGGRAAGWPRLGGDPAVLPGVGAPLQRILDDRPSPMVLGPSCTENAERTKKQPPSATVTGSTSTKAPASNS